LTLRVDDADLPSARALLDRHAWEEAYALLSTDPESPDPAWCEALAEAAWWTGRLQACIAGRERAYALLDAAGDRRGAGRNATWLFEHHCFRAQPSIGGGWLRRARRALAGDPECVEHGYLLLREAQQAHGGGDLVLAMDRAEAAVELGRRLRSADLEAIGLEAIGRVLIDRGQPAEGLAHLDEAMLFALEGRLDPYTTGRVFCSLVSACEEIGDLRRAAEWTDAVAAWAEQHPVSLFPGLCRVHRAGLLQWRGAWPEAEAEARLACAELEGINLPNAADGFVKVGEIRRRIGDHQGAEEAFRRAEELNGQAWAGLALLRLAQGRHDTAAAIIARALEEAGPNRLARGKLLPTHVQVMVATGEVEAAAAGTDELEQVATEFESPVLLAAAATARGRVRLATGDHGGACSALNDAVRRWTELDVPYEVATTRTLMGQACRQSGDEDGAEEAFSAAEAIFERLGAETDARTTRGFRSTAPMPGGLTQREAEVLRLLAAGRTNRQLAGELHLSEKTVARHVSNIFTKIGVRSRAAATAWAFEHRLVSGSGS
jgi:DNA-binding CsgD family transcriptional regulator